MCRSVTPLLILCLRDKGSRHFLVDLRKEGVRTNVTVVNTVGKGVGGNSEEWRAGELSQRDKTMERVLIE